MRFFWFEITCFKLKSLLHLKKAKLYRFFFKFELFLSLHLHKDGKVTICIAEL